MASPSPSYSENRFRVTFQTQKATIATAATPPATERPMIVDIFNVDGGGG